MALTQTLATVGPLAVSVDATSRKFLFYDQGVYFESTCYSGRHNHLILAVGYGTEVINGETLGQAS